MRQANTAHMQAEPYFTFVYLVQREATAGKEGDMAVILLRVGCVGTGKDRAGPGRDHLPREYTNFRFVRPIELHTRADTHIHTSTPREEEEIEREREAVGYA